MFEDLLSADEGHPQMGKDLKLSVVKAGFENPRVTAKYGASTQALCDAIRAAYDRWKDHPGAFAALAFGEVIANKPLA